MLCRLFVYWLHTSYFLKINYLPPMVPPFQDFFRPILEYSQQHGAFHVQELYAALAEEFKLSEQDKEELLPSGKQPKYRE